MIISGLLYKEWIKTRWVLLGSLLVLLVTLLLWRSALTGRITSMNPVLFMFSVAVKQYVYQFPFKYLPVGMAIVLALFQFIPEVMASRYRLTMQLPFNEAWLTLNMVLYGVVALISLTGFLYIGFWMVSIYFIPSPLIWWSSSLMLTWLISGFTAYFWLVSIVLEPSWNGRIFMSGVLCGLLYIALGNSKNGTTLELNYYLMAITALSFTLPNYFMYRLRKGRS